MNADIILSESDLSFVAYLDRRMALRDFGRFLSALWEHGCET